MLKLSEKVFDAGCEHTYGYFEMERGGYLGKGGETPCMMVRKMFEGEGGACYYQLHLDFDLISFLELKP